MLSVAISNLEAHAFLRSCLDFLLSELITQPAWPSLASASILDLILTNNPDAPFNINHPDRFSDHDIFNGRFVLSINKGTTSMKV